MSDESPRGPDEDVPERSAGDAPNANTLWGRILVSELRRAGATAACVAPGSRSTPLTLALAGESGMTVTSHLDERSAAYFALGRAKRTGEPTVLVCTSGTAAANFHPAVIEAGRSRTPLVVCTADRPPELQESGANQTVDQEGIYGDAVRWERTLPEPEADARKLRALRTTAARAVAASTRPPAGPVHLDVPFRKPLEPTPVPGDVPADLDETAPLGASGRRGPFVAMRRGPRTIDDRRLDEVVDLISAAERGLIVAGPADPNDPAGSAAGSIASLAEATGFPLLADPLSGLRFGPHVADSAVCGGYDVYLDPAITDGWPEPDLVLRFGASPTSKPLREYLARTAPRQFLVDPAGGWREATFTATDLLEADPDWFAEAVAGRVDGTGEVSAAWAERFRRAESAHWDAQATESRFFEGAVVADVLAEAPDPATVFVSNSMPVRDADRFGRPAERELTVLGNRGASGVDGITSTALGAGSAVSEPLVLVTGDLAYYHDTNGLLAISRCDVDATIVVLDNDGGGIFHTLPIAEHDAFEEWFVTPHGLDFEPTGELYDLAFSRVDSLSGFRSAYRDSLAADGSQVICVESDAEESFAVREELADAVRGELVDE